MAELRFRTDLENARWDAFVGSHPGATFFHAAGWRDVISGAFDHAPHFIAAMRGADIVGVLPLIEVKSRLFGHSLISNAFCVGGGPLAIDSAARDALVAEAERVGRSLGVDYVEVRDVAAMPGGWSAREGQYAGFAREIAATEENCLKQIPRKQRAVLRKALASGLTFTVGQDVKAFFNLYARTVRNHGTPVLPRRYFQRLVDTFGERCNILTVFRNGTPISSVLNFYFRDRVLPYYTGGTADARGIGANDLMYWHLMRYAYARGCTLFDFGRSKLGTGPSPSKRIGVLNRGRLRTGSISSDASLSPMSARPIRNMKWRSRHGARYPCRSRISFHNSLARISLNR